MIDTKNLFPWNKIEDRYFLDKKENTHKMVFIPKFYVKNELLSGGKFKKTISNQKADGFHCHPAFMHLGQETKGLLISKYLIDSASGTSKEDGTPLQADYAAAKKIATERGMYLYNIWHHSMIQLLMLMECGTADCTAALGFAENEVNPIWHGINHVYGSVLNFWIDGVTSDADGNLSIIDQYGNGSMQQLYTDPIGSGYVKHVCADSDEFPDWSLDLFIASELTDDINQATYPDRQKFVKNTIALSATSFNDKRDGIFGFEAVSADTYGAQCKFAAYVE